MSRRREAAKLRPRVAVVLGSLCFATACCAADDSSVAASAPGVATAPIAAKTILATHRVLLLVPPPAEMISELYDFYLIVSERAATGEISPRWAAYLYVTHFRDMARDRPQAVPRRSREELRRELEENVEFYYIRKRPEAEPAPFGAWVWQAAPQ
ncbi:MAG: hypothetical protein HY270_19075 [Deltaproteobacteria bacterium]|nr:hypothetical protein [Deltaproteobacteria bacterium]